VCQGYIKIGTLFYAPEHSNEILPECLLHEAVDDKVDGRVENDEKVGNVDYNVHDVGDVHAVLDKKVAHGVRSIELIYIIYKIGR
jgi:hypothetical protein